MWAVVPLKSPDTAKSRLSPTLDPAQRRALFFSMAQHVLRTLRATPGITRVAVVTANPEIGRFAKRLNTMVIRQTQDAGTADAFAAAVDYLRPNALDSLLMISGDLPLLSREAVSRMIADTRRHPGIVIAPDRRGVGTNALRCTPPDAIKPSFGVDSLTRHLAIAREHQLPVEIVHMQELALDLDVAADLDYLQHRSTMLPVQSIPKAEVNRFTARLPARG